MAIIRKSVPPPKYVPPTPIVRSFHYTCPNCGVHHDVDWDIYNDLDVTHAEEWDGLCPVCEEEWVGAYQDMEDEEDGT